MRRNELVEQMRPLLLQRRDAILRTLNDDLPSTLSVDHSDVRDTGDTAIETEYREVMAELAEVESRELRRIDDALLRLRAGQYGVCVECERNIPLTRLRAIPYATKCIRCQQQADRLTATGSSAKINSVADAASRVVPSSWSEDAPVAGPTIAAVDV